MASSAGCVDEAAAREGKPAVVDTEGKPVTVAIGERPVAAPKRERPAELADGEKQPGIVIAGAKVDEAAARDGRGEIQTEAGGAGAASTGSNGPRVVVSGGGFAVDGKATPGVGAGGKKPENKGAAEVSAGSAEREATDNAEEERPGQLKAEDAA